MARSNIIKIFLISLILSSCTTTLNNFSDKGQEKEQKSYLIDYSLRKEKIQKRYADISHDSKDNIKIAVMLPLSGTHSKLGNSLFNSMQLALFDHKDPRIQLVPFDTKGNEYESITQAKNIVEGNYAIILGPVFAKNVKAIKPILKDQNIKLISFSNDPEIAGNNVYLIGQDIKEQVRSISNYSYKQGFTNFISLLPSNDYGSTIVTELRRVAELKNLTILKSEFYSKQTSLEKNVRNIARAIREHIEQENRAKLAAKAILPENNQAYDPLAENELAEPQNPKIAILVAEGGIMLKNILALMHKYNIPQERVQLIGLNSWYDNTDYNDPYMENAWFTDIPHNNYDLFISYYKSYFFSTPPRISSLSYDALSVVTSLAGLNEDGADFSNEMLTQKIGFNGISGVFRFKDTGISERLLAIYGIEAGSVVKISTEEALFKEEENIALEDNPNFLQSH